MKTIFVYGTLKKGGALNAALNNSKFVKKDVVEGYDMYDLGSFPAITPGEGKVYGELYLINEEIESLLDRIEGYPYLYNKKEVKKDIFAYYMDETKLKELKKTKIKSGHWPINS
jgi:gamma-glutamylcyclotransferase (GGCT)/AIG2-like uncharacterized protein YtfP